MDLENSFLELKGLSKTIRIFHGLGPDENQNSYASDQTALPVELWTKFFQLHAVMAKEKIRQDPLFRLWNLYLNQTLESFDSENELAPDETVLQELLATSKLVVTQVSTYYKLIAENQLSFLNAHSISFSQDYLSEAVDYYSFWHAKFDKIICRSDVNDIDVVLLVDSLKLFNENHEELQKSVVHWPLPLGCHHPKFDNTLDMFLASLPTLPMPEYSSPREVRIADLTSKSIVQEEYVKLVRFLTGYAKQLEVRCGTIFPMPQLLDRRFKSYKEELEDGIGVALAPIRLACDQYEKSCEVPQSLMAYVLLNDAINSVNSCGKILVVAKRRIKETVSKFLLYYYRDVLRHFKRGKKAALRLQKKKPRDLSFQLQIRNRIRAYRVWKDAIESAISGVKEGRMVVISNVYQAQFYFLDFVDEVAACSRVN